MKSVYKFPQAHVRTSVHLFLRSIDETLCMGIDSNSCTVMLCKNLNHIRFRSHATLYVEVEVAKSANFKYIS